MSLEEERNKAEAAAKTFELTRIFPLEAQRFRMFPLVKKILEREARLSMVGAELKQGQARFNALLNRYNLKPTEGKELGVRSSPTLKILSGILSHELGVEKNKWRGAVSASVFGEAAMSGAKTRAKFEVYKRLKMDPATKDPAMLAAFSREMKIELEPYEAAKRAIAELEARVRECAGNFAFLQKIQEKLNWIQANALAGAELEALKQFRILEDALSPGGSLRAELRSLKEAPKKIQERIWIEKNKGAKIIGSNVTGSLRNDVDTGPG